ncbi:MAG: sigma-70 family RNA polymerase sigma factor [Clostridia bacterium]|nr:sigma-70 family RNA polymerase sigma factor [Clostridia bacterium]
MSLFRPKTKAERFEAFAAEHERMVYLVCLRMMGNAQDAEDCAQEALLSAYRAFDSFRGDSSEKTWLYRIATNTCLDALRRRRETVSLEALREEGFDPADTRMPQHQAEAERKDLREQIKAAVAALPEDQRVVLVLRDFQQLPYEEIAETLSISEGTVKSRLNRAREKVKKTLADMEQIAPGRVKVSEGRQK